MFGNPPRAVPTSIYQPSKRQVVANADGLDSLGYNDGQYDPTQSVVTEAGAIYSSLDENALTTEDLDAATTSIATAQPTDSAAISSIAAVSSSVSSDASSSSISSSASASASTAANLASNGNSSKGGFHFHITYLIPIFVIVGLVLVFAVGGKIWGRIAYSKERALRRKTRHERQMIREQRKEKKERAELVRQQWEQNGWGESLSPDASFEKQRPDESDSELDYQSEDELKGPLSAIGTHLAGVKRGRPLPPARRIEHGRYESKVEANNWLGTQWRRNFEQDNQRGIYTGQSQMVTPDGSEQVKRATLRGTWERVKLRITENIGWGYDGNTPDVTQRRQIVANASSNTLWTRVPLENHDMPHTQAGILLPPQLGEDGYPIVMPIAGSGRPKRSLFPLNSRQREGSYSPPVLKAPPNTIKALPVSGSKSSLTSVKDIFTAFRGKSSQSLADAARRGKHERLRSEQDEWEEKPAYMGHSHEDGRKCSLDEPQYLPPTRRGSQLHTNEATYYIDEKQLPQAPAPLCYTPSKDSTSIHRKPSSLGNDQIIRSRTLSSRKRDEEAERATNTEQPTSIMRNKSNRSMALSRSSTVRFSEAAETDNSAASFILSYSTMQTPRTDLGSDIDDEEEMVVSPTRRLSRAKTTTGKKAADSKDDSIRRYKSMAVKNAAASPTSSVPRSELSRSQSRIQARSEMKRSQSVKSSRSYTESVNFGERLEGEEAVEEKKAFIPAVDSRILTRTRTRKGGLSNLALNVEAMKKNETESPQEVVVMDLTQPPSEAQVPGLSSGTSSTESDDIESEVDVENEIDSALISLIARSNTSKSYYHPFPAVDSPRTYINRDTPTMGSPLGRKKTWQERNGKWERLTPEEIEAMNAQEEDGGTPGKAFSYTASPPPLPPPPVWTQPSSPIRSSTVLPPSLAVASRNLSSVMLAESKTPLARGGRGDLFIRPPPLYTTSRSRSLSPTKANSILSPSDYGDDGGEGEEDFEEEGSVFGTPTRSALSSNSTRSQQSAVSSRTNSSTVSSSNTNSSTSTSPQRRTAVAKRAAARPPRRYQAKLGGEGEEALEGNESPRNSRLHTGKSLRTPAEKDRERQFAMDRVQSIVTKGHARRQQSS